MYLIGTFIILFTLGWMSGTNHYIVNKWTNKIEVTDTFIIHGEPFSEEALVKTLKNCNIKYPHIILAQAKLESANFTSKVFKQNHNMFGMRMAKVRLTTAERENNMYAMYRDWKEGVYDMGMWQSAMVCNINNEEEYFNKLQEKYAEDTTYVSKLKNIIKKSKLRRLFED